MNQDLTDMANEAFPAGPDRVALYPAAGQQRVLTALQQDVTAGQHLLCVTGPADSGKTVLLRALQQRLGPGLVALIENPTPGHVLIDVASALHLDMTDDDETILRRQLVVMLSTIEKQRIPIIQIVDDADRLTTDDLNLLMHFFPTGHATLILAGVTPPQACVADGATASGAAPAVHAYRIDPLSADETAGYIRHRLREAALPEDLFPPNTIAAIHQKSGGLPGAINRYCAEVLAQAEGQKNDKLAAAEPATASSIKAQTEMLWPTLDEDIVADILTAPVRKRGYRKTSAAPVTSEPAEVTHEYDAVAKQVRRLRRRAHRWRAVWACSPASHLLACSPKTRGSIASLGTIHYSPHSVIGLPVHPLRNVPWMKRINRRHRATPVNRALWHQA
ncbi:MAG: ExeA family protein [Gammaproteobacteria bacterium]